jgi:CDP-diacylglycerol--glycerol-3-phosphate 3-phosphatidyltransferase/cardiolipin synthase
MSPGWLGPRRGPATGARAGGHATARRGGLSLDEIVLLPNLVSLLRLPLAVAFPLVSSRPALAVGVLALAGATDVADGQLARRLGQVTFTGAIVDPLADKAFAVSVVATLVGRHALPLWAVPLLLARELCEAPLLAWTVATGRHRAACLGEVTANVPGKVATVAQFVAVLAAIAWPAALRPLLVACAASGAVAGAAYWRRALAAGGAAPRL